MSDKSVLLFCEGIDDVILGLSNVAGIQVQMSFWAKMFVQRGWRVYALTKGDAKTLDGISFIEQKKNWLDRCRLSILNELMGVVSVLSQTKPDLLIFRGASRYTYFLCLFCRLFGTKFVFLSASDTDFQVGSELVSGSGLNVALFRKSVSHINYIVTQNMRQAQLLKDNYGKESMVLPNIWPSADHDIQRDKRYDCVWVANLRKLKRVEWFLALAAKMPDCRFAIIGGTGGDEQYYEDVKAAAEAMANVTFFGAKPFAEVNDLIGQSRILVCTSEFEGFPNTFLQAWAIDVPVVSTVNPNNVVTEHKLGEIVDDDQQLYDSVKRLQEDNQLYGEYKSNIEKYFNKHHDAERGVVRLLDYIYH